MRYYNPFKGAFEDLQIQLPIKAKADNLIATIPFFDMHTHVRLNGQEDYQSLEKAAIAGGYSAVLIQPNTKPELATSQVFEQHLNLAKDKLIDFFWSCSLFGELEPDSTKILCYSNDGIHYDTLKIVEAFKRKKPHLLLDHSQLHELDGAFYEGTNVLCKKRPINSEAVSIFRNVLLGVEYGFSKFHIQHVSTKMSIETICFLRRFAQVSCEVTPHHLFFTMEDVKNTNFKINPPLATKSDRETLLKAVKDGIIDVLATDHAPHPDKPQDFELAPFGSSGIEIAFSAFYTILEDLKLVFDKLIVAPRKLLKVPLPNGFEDLVVVDPDASFTVDCKKFFSKGKNCVFDGIKLKGKVVGMKLKGRWVYWDGEFLFNKEGS
ncbi:dihydroorotase [Pseudothermotoga thermarum]|uniref:Dihydroorotase n=1 Tax=Pseudothermotoga thermarum DSM 5069 TaxID=688269 RepID=F7YWH1_9THEM|nr:dihydroorotase [Pseudothermotoga thermarum]AEH51950.1 dihydroorotase [Pseudothermotoga thermarum DSM 5069]